MDDNVIICRCQEITYGEIVKAIEDGAISVTGVKKRVGSGMGSCQGQILRAPCCADHFRKDRNTGERAAAGHKARPRSPR